MNARRMLATLAMGAGLVLAPAAHAATTTTSRVIIVQCTGAGYALQVGTPKLPAVPGINAPMGNSPCHVKSCLTTSNSTRLWIGKWTQPYPPIC